MKRIGFVFAVFIMTLGAQEKEIQAESYDNINNIVKKSLSYYPSIHAALSRAKASVEGIGVDKGGFFPTLDFTGRYGRQKSESPGISALGKHHQEMTRKENSLRLRQLIFDGGVTSSRVDQAKARSKEQFALLAYIRQQVVFQAAGSYLEARQLQQLLDNAKMNLEAHQKIEDLVLKRVEKKVDDKASAHLVKGRKSIAEASVKRYEKLLESVLIRLKKYTGEDIRDLKAVPDDLFLVKAPEDYEKTLEHHPAIEVNSSRIEASQAHISERKRRFSPEIYLEAIGRQDDNLDGVDGENAELGVYLTVNFNLFRGGSDRAAYLQALELHDANSSDRKEIRLELSTAVAVAHKSYEAAASDLKLFTEHQQSVVETLKAYNSQYLIGKRSLFDLLNIQTEVFRANETVIQAEFNKKSAAFEVLNEAGTLQETLNK